LIGFKESLYIWVPSGRWRGLWPVHFLNRVYVVRAQRSGSSKEGEIMRYKSAEIILVEIGEDDQASARIRLAAIEMLVEIGTGKLPELKGYESGSPENLLLRLASDSKATAKERFKAIKQLLGKKKLPVPGKEASRSNVSVTESHQSL
jgi:hypothetical protein